MTYAALRGVRVVEITTFVAGPLAGRILADLGASVVKVEPPGRGDDARNFPPFFEGVGAFFVQCNRNKQSVAVDLADEAGRSVVHDLVRRSDVFLSNMRPGALARLGMDYDTLAQLNDRLVYCSISGFGSFGPDADRAAYDGSIQAMSGMMRSSGSTEEMPLAVGPSVIDNASAGWAVTGVLAALRESEKTGVGGRVDISLMGSAMDIMSTDIVRTAATGAFPLRGRGDWLFPTADSEWMQLAIGNDRIFRDACAVLGRESLCDDPRFATSRARKEHRSALREQLEQAVSTRSAREWEEDFVARGVPASRVRRIDEVLEEKTLVGGHIESFVGDTGAEIPQVRTPIDFGDGATQLRTPPPRVGEHTAQVLTDLLGYDGAQLDDLLAAGVVADAGTGTGMSS